MENQNETEKLKYREYFTEIEETFTKCRGKNLMLSPTDWSLMESWQKRGIPAEIVCNAILKCFARQTNPSQIKSISYCKHQVEEDFEDAKSD